MKSFTAVDLEKLARGQRLPGDAFRSLFADAAAVADLARLLQVRQLLTAGELDWRPPPDAPEMDVTWEELARHGEGRPLDPARQVAVERFLDQHFPQACLPAAEGDTVEFPRSQDTQVEFGPADG
jgi:hypothetical protein